MDSKQKQTKECFDYKWARRDTYEGRTMKNKTFKWLLSRYFESSEKLEEFLNIHKGKSIMDAGCGSGFTASVLFGKHLNQMKYLGVDISDAIKVARNRFSELGIRGEFLKASVTSLKISRKFDIIFCEGVLHHTTNPFKSLKNLVKHLNKNGIIMFYVYKKKAPIREFTDDYIRKKLAKLTNEETWQRLLSLTKLGKSLGDLNKKVTIKEDVELLGIQKGTYDVQRLFYWFFVKMYYDKNFSIDEMNHINFDWFRPLNCYRFTPLEIETWLKKLKLKKQRFVVEEAGITVVAKKI